MEKLKTPRGTFNIEKFVNYPKTTEEIEKIMNDLNNQGFYYLFTNCAGGFLQSIYKNTQGKKTRYIVVNEPF